MSLSAINLGQSSRFRSLEVQPFLTGGVGQRRIELLRKLFFFSLCGRHFLDGFSPCGLKLLCKVPIFLSFGQRGSGGGGGVGQWLGRRILRSVDRYIPGRGAPHEQGRQSCDEERPYHRKRLVQDRRQIREAYERVTRDSPRTGESSLLQGRALRPPLQETTVICGGRVRTCRRKAPTCSGWHRPRSARRRSFGRSPG